jgi:peptide/nickel transport system substrate-binding protein
MSRRPLRLAALALPLVLAIPVVAGWASADGTRSSVTASAVTGSAGAAATGGLVINMPVGPATLDPAEACGLTDITVIENVYSRLTKYGSKPGPNGTTQVDPGKIVPYAAKSWTISKNGLVYTFKLRSGMKFASGKPVDAAAVKFSMMRSVTMGGCGGYFIYDGIYTPPLIKSIVTPDPLTVKITLSVRDANVLQDWAQPAASIVDPSVVNAHGGVQKGKVNTYMAGHVAGYGPYNLQSYEPNKSAVLVANPSFFAQPKSKKVTMNFVASDPTLLLQARSGAADVTLGLTKQSAHSLASNSSVNVIANDTSVGEWLGLANDKPPFNNAKFREAVSYAVPYQQILDKVAFGYGTLIYGPFPAAMPEFNKTLEKPRTLDLAKAKALIASSGVSTPVSVGLDIQAGNSNDEQIATIVQGTWQQLGINVTVNKLSAADYINKLEQHKSQSFIRLDGPGVIEAGYFLGYDLKCGISFNLSAVCIKEADTLLAKARQTQDKAARQKLWDEITRLWIAQSPKIPVYSDKFTAVVNKRVKGYFYSHELDVTGWYK